MSDHLLDVDRAVHEIEMLAERLRDADLTTAVPTCPEWTLRDLVEHVGGIHRWATAMVKDQVSEPIRRDTLDLGVPGDDALLAGWVAAGAETLGEVMRTADPDAPMWAWGADQHVRFWSRRMVHETAIHRADAVLALGQPFELEVNVAIDGIDELLENLPAAAGFSKPVRELRGDGQTITLQTTDVPQSWHVTLTDDGFRWSHDDLPSMASISGTSTHLLLALYHRLAAEEPYVTITGDVDLAGFWLAQSAF